MTVTADEEAIIERAREQAKRIGVGHATFLALLMDYYLNHGMLPVSGPAVIDLPDDSGSAPTERKYIQLKGRALEVARAFVAHATERQIRPGRLLALLILAAGDNLARARIHLSFDATSVQQGCST